MVMTPEKFLRGGKKLVTELTQKVAEKLKEAKATWHGEPQIKVVVSGEYIQPIRQKVVEKYESAGWNVAEHKTSSEAGENPGLTMFVFRLGTVKATPKDTPTPTPEPGDGNKVAG